MTKIKISFRLHSCVERAVSSGAYVHKGKLLHAWLVTISGYIRMVYNFPNLSSYVCQQLHVDFNSNIIKQRYISVIFERKLNKYSASFLFESCIRLLYCTNLMQVCLLYVLYKKKNFENVPNCQFAQTLYNNKLFSRLLAIYVYLL